MGHGPERHDIHSYETHAGAGSASASRCARVARSAWARPVAVTYEANPGEVWEENEFWIELSWRIDPDGSLGHPPATSSRPTARARRSRVDEYYRWMFENSVPGLPEKAAAEGLDPLGYMRKYGVVEISREDYDQHEAEAADLDDTDVRGTEDVVTKRTQAGDHLPLTGRPDRSPTAGRRRRHGAGFTRRRASSSSTRETLAEWGWPEHATPTYVRSHVHPALIDHEHGE